MDRQRWASAWVFLSGLACLAAIIVVSAPPREPVAEQQSDTAFPQIAQITHLSHDGLGNHRRYLILAEDASKDGAPAGSENLAEGKSPVGVRPDEALASGGAELPAMQSEADRPKEQPLAEPKEIESFGIGRDSIPESASQALPEAKPSEAAAIESGGSDPVAIDASKPVNPEGKVASQVIEPPAPEAPPTEGQTIRLPDSFRRIPELLANIPSAIGVVPHDELPMSNSAPPSTLPVFAPMFLQRDQRPRHTSLTIPGGNLTCCWTA